MKSPNWLKGYVESLDIQPMGRYRSDCPVCGKYSFQLKDDLYMNKFDCCYECFIQYIQGREERWDSGWRPDNTRAIIK